MLRAGDVRQTSVQIECARAQMRLALSKVEAATGELHRAAAADDFHTP